MNRRLTPLSQTPSDCKVSEVHPYIRRQPLALPLYLSAVSAGFPSPADDFLDRPLDLNEHLIRNPAATFFVRVSGDSMLGAGIHNGDILIVDRSLDPTPGRIVIAAVDGELTVKRLVQEGDRWLLVAENDGYPAIALDEVGDSLIWGVVRHVIHSV
jgi:DNA polymerase V